MNIGVDTKALQNGHAGISRYLWSVLNALADIDRTNTYFLFCKHPEIPLPQAENFRKTVLPSHLPGTLWLQWHVARACPRLGIDVLWCPEGISPVAPITRSTAKVITIHDLTFRRFPASMQLTNFWIHALMFRRSLHAAARIIAISNSTRNDLLACYPTPPLDNKISVVHNGRPEWRMPDTYSPDSRGTHLLYVGSSEPRKNVLGVLKALALLRSQAMNIHLRIIGPPGWKNRTVREFVKKQKLDTQVHWVGYVDEHTLIKEYLCCKALIFPSLLEGFGLPVLEALSTDTLVLTSRKTVMEEIGNGAVMLFDPTDTQDIARTIKAIYQPDFERSHLLRNAASVLSRFSWERAACGHLQSFQQAVPGNRSSRLNRDII